MKLVYDHGLLDVVELGKVLLQVAVSLRSDSSLIRTIAIPLVDGVDDLHSQVTLSFDSVGELSTSRDLLNQLFQVIATEIDLKYFEDEDLIDLISSQNGEFAFASLD